MRQAVLSTLLLLAGLAPRAVVAEVVLLANGGQLVATPLIDSELTDTQHVALKLESGGLIVLHRDQILRVETTQVTEQHYFDEAAKYADTAAAQWQLAQWCQQRGLAAPFQRHVQRVLELEPNHLPARQALGHQKRGDKWMTQEEIMHERGYIRFEGRWMTQQQAALRLSRQRIESQQNDWKLRLQRWRTQLGKNRTPEDQVDFRTLNDPQAIPALIQLLGAEQDLSLSLLYIQTLGRIGNAAAMDFLMAHAVYQNNTLYREACLKEVLARKHPQMVDYYVNLLKHYDNAIVNRAAAVLAELGYDSAIVPLASALRTEHLANHSRRYTYFYTALGRDGFDVDGPRESYRTLTLPQFLSRTRNAYDTQWFRNDGVHQALIKICDGQDLGYNPENWKAWYRQQRAPTTPPIRLARDN